MATSPQTGLSLVSQRDRRRKYGWNVEIKYGTRFRDLERDLSNPRRITRRIGAMLAGRNRSAFRADVQRRGPFKWAARKSPNIPGIIKDLKRGVSVKANRFGSGRPALVDTRTLQKSISWRIRGDNTVLIFSSVNYGAVHQEGGISSIKYTASSQKNLVKFLKINPEKRDSLGWILGSLSPGDAISTHVRKRPFMLITENDQARAREIALSVLFKGI